jgi:hypothetical protein
MPGMHDFFRDMTDSESPIILSDDGALCFLLTAFSRGEIFSAPAEIHPSGDLKNSHAFAFNRTEVITSIRNP